MIQHIGNQNYRFHLVFHNFQDYIVCQYKKTRNGFKHEAEILYNCCTVHSAKCCYLNRTWESYDYQSVIHKAIDGYIKDSKLAKRYKKAIDKKALGLEEKRFAPLKMICTMRDLLCESNKDKADWKKRMMKTIPGVDFPDDFDSLPDEEKNRRMDAALKTL